MKLALKYFLNYFDIINMSVVDKSVVDATKESKIKIEVEKLILQAEVQARIEILDELRNGQCKQSLLMRVLESKANSANEKLLSMP